MEGNLPRYELIFDEEKMLGVYGVSLVNDPAIQIEALRFSRVQDCDFSKDDVPSELIDKIISKGETIDLSQWEKIDEKIVDSEDVYSIDLATRVEESEGASEQDNEIFKVRYEYSPNTTSANSRDFCIRMASAGLSYKKEDLVSSNANAGFGPNGASTYNIFLYKGGVNCQHYWSRTIYLQKNNKKMNVFEALKFIGNLDKETVKKAKLEANPSEVSQVASSSNNHWKLSSELRDIKMADEEKRILTSPVLLPEQDIYRNFDGEQCNVFLTADTIERLMINYSEQQYQKNSSLEHSEVIEGVLAFENWIVKNPKNDKSNELGFNVPAGTWMMSMKVKNQEIWNEYVKTGLIKGFSIDAKLGVQKNTKNKSEKMNYSKVKQMVLKSILMETELKEFKIDENLSVFAETLDTDMVVFDKDNLPYANSEFTFEGKVYKTGENGEIVSIEEVEVEEEVVEAEGEAPADSAKLQEDLDVANKRIEELETENQALKAELISVKEEAVALSKQPKVEAINLKNVQVEDYKPKSTLDVIRESLKGKK